MVAGSNSALAAWYSAGNNPLKQVVKRRENDATGKGQCKRAPHLSTYG